MGVGPGGHPASRPSQGQTAGRQGGSTRTTNTPREQQQAQEQCNQWVAEALTKGAGTADKWTTGDNQAADQEFEYQDEEDHIIMDPHKCLACKVKHWQKWRGESEGCEKQWMQQIISRAKQQDNQLGISSQHLSRRLRGCNKTTGAGADS